eukprot:TRINITY_DN60341_c0_g1_i1.p1 TRINITY_DN60341_c0_g1~~TRINITY_DN60341_c0_g1_i1.p1  ORF type:complete len:670 (+),score=148.41 TRINITY_DN60341_c0_g1_i1:94-2010(+)
MAAAAPCSPGPLVVEVPREQENLEHRLNELIDSSNYALGQAAVESEMVDATPLPRCFPVTDVIFTGRTCSGKSATANMFILGEPEGLFISTNAKETYHTTRVDFVSQYEKPSIDGRTFTDHESFQRELRKQQERPKAVREGADSVEAEQGDTDPLPEPRVIRVCLPQAVGAQFRGGGSVTFSDTPGLQNEDGGADDELDRIVRMATAHRADAQGRRNNVVLIYVLAMDSGISKDGPALHHHVKHLLRTSGVPPSRVMIANSKYDLFVGTQKSDQLVRNSIGWLVPVPLTPTEKADQASTQYQQWTPRVCRELGVPEGGPDACMPCANINEATQSDLELEVVRSMLHDARRRIQQMITQSRRDTVAEDCRGAIDTLSQRITQATGRDVSKASLAECGKIAADVLDGFKLDMEQIVRQQGRELLAEQDFKLMSTFNNALLSRCCDPVHGLCMGLQREAKKQAVEALAEKMNCRVDDITQSDPSLGDLRDNYYSKTQLVGGCALIGVGVVGGGAAVASAGEAALTSFAVAGPVGAGVVCVVVGGVLVYRTLKWNYDDAINAVCQMYQGRFDSSRAAFLKMLNRRLDSAARAVIVTRESRDQRVVALLQPCLEKLQEFKQRLGVTAAPGPRTEGPAAPAQLS